MAATESSTRAMAALDDLYRRHVGDVYRYTYAVLGNHADAEDVTQTTFVNALRALERGERPRDASHWLLAIAHNLVRQRWRQAAARPAMVELAHDVPDGAPDEDDIQLDELVRALQRIPPSQREALVMRELEGRPYREIAELLGLSTSALETLLFRARRSLADELENLVTCQSAELALSRRSDGRLTRKERRRLEEHIADCPSCARLSQTQARQRKAFKGLTVLPVPIGLALFKGAPVATAATVSTIGEAATAAGAGGVGTGGAAASGGAAAGGSVGAGGAVAGGSLLGGAAVKIAAIVAAASVAVGVGYEGIQALRHAPPAVQTASTEPKSAKAAPFGQAGTPTPRVPGSTDSGRGPQPASPAEAGAIGSAATSARKGALADGTDAAGDASSDGDVAGSGGEPSSGGAPGTGGAPAGGDRPAGDDAPPGNDDPPPGTPPAGGEAPASDDGGATVTPQGVSEPGVRQKPKKARPPKAAKKPKPKPKPKPEATTTPKPKPAAKSKPKDDGTPAAAPKTDKDPSAGAPPKQDKEPTAAPSSPPAPAPAAGTAPTDSAPPSDAAPPAEGEDQSGKDSGAGRDKPGKS